MTNAADRRTLRIQPRGALLAVLGIVLVIGTVVSWSWAVRAEKQAVEARRREGIVAHEMQQAEEQRRVAKDEVMEARRQVEIAQANELMALELKQRAQTEVAHARRQVEIAQAKELFAQELKQRAQTTAAALRRSLYFAQMNLVRAAWDEGRVSRANELLEQQEPPRGEIDLRGFEWHYWNRLVRPAPMSLEGHKSLVSVVASVAFSPDGKQLASAGWDGTVKLWDATTGQITLTLKGHAVTSWGEYWVNSVAFSPDGKRLVSTGGDQTVRVWDAATGEELRILKGHISMITSATFSPDGQRVAAVGGGAVKVWDITTGEVLLTLQGQAVAFHPDGIRVASISSDGKVEISDESSGQKPATSNGETRLIWNVAFSPDGKRLASGSFDRSMNVWEASNVHLPANLKIRDAATGQDLLTLKGHGGGITSVAFSADGKRLASSGQDHTIKVWDTSSGQVVATLKGHTGMIWCVAFSPDGKRLASGSADGSIKVWEVSNAQLPEKLTGHTSAVTCVAASPDGKWLASGSDDRSVKVWDALSGVEKMTLRFGDEAGAVSSVAFSPDSTQLAAAGANQVTLWDAVSGQELLHWKCHTNPKVEAGASTPGRSLISVAFNLDGTLIATGSSIDPNVKVWDAKTGVERLTLKGHTGGVLSIAFSPFAELFPPGESAPFEVVVGMAATDCFSRLLASGSVDQTLRTWDAMNGQEGATVRGHSGAVTSVLLAPNANLLASGSTDGTVKLWDGDNVQETLTLKGHSAAVTSVAISPDGQRLASASSDHTVKLWDVASGQETLTLKGHSAAVTSVAFSPDGQRLISASRDQTVRIWNATPLP